jgi:hypothetical protein
MVMQKLRPLLVVNVFPLALQPRPQTLCHQSRDNGLGSLDAFVPIFAILLPYPCLSPIHVSKHPFGAF